MKLINDVLKKTKCIYEVNLVGLTDNIEWKQTWVDDEKT